MQPSTVILCAVVILLHGVSCRLFPEVILDPLTTVNQLKDYKRQTISELRQCVSEGITAAFPGNTSSFVSACRASATQNIIEYDSSSLNAAYLQSVLNTVYPTFCIPDCGNVALDVYNDCGVFDTFPGSEKITADLCSTNEKGEVCYKIYGDGFNLITSERACYDTYQATDQCTCRSVLSNGVSEQGCCINIYHDFVSGIPGAYNPDRLYSECNVDRPADCNNSPISGSISLVSTATLILSLACIAVLG